MVPLRLVGGTDVAPITKKKTTKKRPLDAASSASSHGLSDQVMQARARKVILAYVMEPGVTIQDMMDEFSANVLAIAEDDPTPPSIRNLQIFPLLTAVGIMPCRVTQSQKDDLDVPAYFTVVYPDRTCKLMPELKPYLNALGGMPL